MNATIALLGEYSPSGRTGNKRYRLCEETVAAILFRH